jgi:hypothetical protein
MNRIWLGALLVVALVAGGQSADGAYCGLANYQHGNANLKTVSFSRARRDCSRCEQAEPTCAAEASCGTRLVKDVVYEQKQYTCYKTVCEKVVEQKEVDCVRYEKEQCYREVEYTVCKPVWETRSRTVNYTVCKPVYETRTKEIPYTVCKPVYETREREICRTVCKPVHFTKTVKVCRGHWETERCEIPGPVVTKCVREPGCWESDCSGRRCYRPGPVKKIQVQCPPRTVCKKVWVPEICEKEVACVRYERETIVDKQCYKVCKMVREQRVKTCCYKVCKMVPEQRVKTYQVCKMVPEQRVRT